MLIYKITNKINNKCYIGQTIKSAEERWKEHKAHAFGSHKMISIKPYIRQ